ncbi:hypothetical protein CEXT_237081, partial [Caerostris extrusa]
MPKNLDNQKPNKNPNSKSNRTTPTQFLTRDTQLPTGGSGMISRLLLARRDAETAEDGQKIDTTSQIAAICKTSTYTA